jgi:cardiolipin synthase A/B
MWHVRGCATPHCALHVGHSYPTEVEDPSARHPADTVNGDCARPARGYEMRTHRLRTILVMSGIVIVGVAAWLLVPPPRRVAYPSPPDALPATDVRAAVTHLTTAERVDVTDLAVSLAPSRVATFKLFIDGTSFFPRILDDIRAARSSVHINQYGIRPGEVYDQFGPLLKEKARQGVAVRMIVDQLGSGIDFRNGALFDDLAASGVQIVRNDPLALDRDGLIGGPRPIDWRLDELAHLDHRKVFVIDGRVAWVGGAGIEDHFYDGSFHDVYARVEGEAVGHVQLVFLSSFRLLGGPLPTGESAINALVPAPAEPGLIPTTVLHNAPSAGHLANTDAIEQLIDGAQHRLDVICPYTADSGILRRMMAAARRGVRVRFVVPADSNVPPMAWALEYWYPDLQAAGVEVWEHPVMAHAKVVLSDDRVLIGTTNLDAWALYRNWEVGVLIEDATIADSVQHDVFDADVADSRPAVIQTNPLVRIKNWLFAFISPLL